MRRALLVAIAAGTLGCGQAHTEGGGEGTDSLASRAAGPDSVDMAAVEQDLAATPGLEDTSRIEPEIDTSLGEGWADSIPVPPWVSDPSFGFSRQYRPIGQGAGRAARQAPRVAAPSASPLVLVRTQGRSVAVIDALLGPKPVTEAEVRLHGTYRLLDDCRTPVAIQRSYRGGESLRMMGRLERTGGAWLFALISPSGTCQDLRKLGYPRVNPDLRLREAIVRALRQPGVLEGELGFASSDVRELAVSPETKDGRRFLWAALRKPEGTQLAPPPAIDQVAIVGVVDGDGSVQVLWQETLRRSTARISLAGVYDTDEDRRAEGIFGVRDSDTVSILRIAPDDLGVWRIKERRDLGRLPS